MCIRDRPQEEIAGPLLPGGANDQLRVRHPGRIQVLGKQILIQIRWGPLPPGHSLCKLASSLDDLVPAAVVQTEVHLDLMIVSGTELCIPAQLLQAGGQLGQVPKEYKMHPVLLHIPECLLQVPAQERCV